MQKEDEPIKNNGKKERKNKKLKKRMRGQNEGVTNLEKKMRDGRTLRIGMVREK